MLIYQRVNYQRLQKKEMPHPGVLAVFFLIYSMGRPSFGIQTWQVKIHYKCWLNGKIIYKWWIFRLVTRGSMVENPVPMGHNIRLRAQELCYIFIPNPSEVKDRFSRVWLKIRQKTHSQ